MRKHYIDNLRSFCILLLFPYHTAMVFNNFGSFYVHGEIVNSFSYFIHVVSVWFMPLLFVLAGISSAYALKRRTAKEYIKERIFKLFIPFAFGLMLLVPAQTYIAEKFHNEYQGGFFEQYSLFFTKQTDLTGYHGGFTPAHLWFLLYLLVISLIALPLMIWYNKREKKLSLERIGVLKLIPLFLLPLLMASIAELGGKSLGLLFALFILGFFILSEEKILERLEHNCFFLLGFSGAFILILIVWYQTIDSSLVYDIFQRFCMWISILALLGLAKRYLNFNNSTTQYLARASFPIYLFHQTILVIVSYFVLKLSVIAEIQGLMICIISLLITLVCYEIAKHIPPLRFMFGIKK